LAELLVAMIVLLPLFWAVFHLGKYADLQQVVVQAGRYAAFQRALQPDERRMATDRIEDQLRARFFLRGDRLPGNPRGELRSADGVAGRPDDPAAAVLWWRDLRGNPLLRGPRQVALSLETRPLGPAPQGIDRFMGQGFGLPAPVLHVAHVEVALSDRLREGGSFLRIGATSAVSADTANAAGTRGVRGALARHPVLAVGTRALSGLQALVSLPMALLEDTAPDMPCIRLETVPADRLVGGPVSPGVCQ
jgi:hypothetical protein